MRHEEYMKKAEERLKKSNLDTVMYTGDVRVHPVEDAFEAPIADMVNSPAHYKLNDIECIEAIEAALTPEEFRGYCKGNSLKYTWRERYKGKSVEDLRKARWYLDRLIGVLENDEQES